MTLQQMTATGPEVYDATTTKTIYNYYDDLESNLNLLKSKKLKSYAGENAEYFCAVILFDAEHLESDGAFNTYHLGYINHIFEDTSYYRCHI